MFNFKLFSLLAISSILIGCVRYDNPNITNPNIKKIKLRKAQIECELETNNRMPNPRNTNSSGDFNIISSDGKRYSGHYTSRTQLSGGEALERAYMKSLAFDLCMEEKGWHKISLFKR